MYQGDSIEEHAMTNFPLHNAEDDRRAECEVQIFNRVACHFCAEKDAEIARLTAGIQLERHHAIQTPAELEHLQAAAADGGGTDVA
jgi:hypothetical protein